MLWGITMAGYIKELLLDYGKSNLHSSEPISDTVIDLEISIMKLVRGGVFKDELRYLSLYLAGYTSNEIANRFNLTTDVIETGLIRLLDAIEELTGYTDQSLVRRLAMSGKYHKSQLTKVSTFLKESGFSYHDI